MLWAALALLGAVLDAGYYALAKRFLPSLEDEVLAAGGFLAASALLFVASLLRGIPAVAPDLLLPVLVTGTINIIAALLVFHALRRTDLSLAVPMITFTLVFLMGSSYLVLGEIPTAAGITGILLIVAGALVMQVPSGGSDPGPVPDGDAGQGKVSRPPDDGSGSSAEAPAPVKSVAVFPGTFLRRITRDRGVLIMLLVSFLYSLSLPFDKAVVLASDAFFGSALVCLYVGGVLAGIALFRGSGRRTIPSAALTAALSIGLVLAGETIAINLAYTFQIVPYVIAVKRLSILFSVFIGGLVFREGGLRFRVPGALVMLGGVALIVLATIPGPWPLPQ